MRELAEQISFHLTGNGGNTDGGNTWTGGTRSDHQEQGGPRCLGHVGRVQIDDLHSSGEPSLDWCTLASFSLDSATVLFSKKKRYCNCTSCLVKIVTTSWDTNNGINRVSSCKLLAAQESWGPNSAASEFVFPNCLTKSQSSMPIDR